MGRVICLKGVLVTPSILSTSQGNYDVQKDTFHTIGKIYYFLLDTYVYPWKILKVMNNGRE